MNKYHNNWEKKTKLTYPITDQWTRKENQYDDGRMADYNKGPCVFTL